MYLQNYIGLSSNMSDIEKFVGTKRGSGILNTTILMLKKNIPKIDQIQRPPQINEIKYHMYAQMKYEEYYAEIEKKTDEFLRKWGDIHLDLDTIL